MVKPVPVRAIRLAVKAGAILAVAIVFGGMLPIGQISAAGILDRWWEDITGGNSSGRAAAAPTARGEPRRIAATDTATSSVGNGAGAGARGPAARPCRW